MYVGSIKPQGNSHLQIIDNCLSVCARARHDMIACKLNEPNLLLDDEHVKYMEQINGVCDGV